MSGNPSKDVMRQPLPYGGDQSAPQDLMNQSFDPTFRTFLNQIVGSPDGVNMYKLKIGSDGLIQTGSGLVPSSYDYIGVTQATTTDTYAYKTGGSGGTLIATLTIAYTDSSKQNIQSITKT